MLLQELMAMVEGEVDWKGGLNKVQSNMKRGLATQNCAFLHLQQHYPLILQNPVQFQIENYCSPTHTRA